MKLGLWLILAMLVTGSRLANADILFIDTDNSPEEIAAAESAAAIRGEALVVFPARNSAQQADLLKMHQFEMEKDRIYGPSDVYMRLYYQAKTDLETAQASPNPNQNTISALNEKIIQYNNTRNQMRDAVQPQIDEVDKAENALANIPYTNSDELRSIILSYRGKQKKIDSIIFSGHHDGTTFTGKLGSVSKQEVIDALNEDRELLAAVRSVLTWGCYSATPAESEWWSTQIPNADIKGGFFRTAPKSSRSADGKFLKGLLLAEAKLRALSEGPHGNDTKAIDKLVRAIPGYSETYASVSTRYTYSRSGLATISVANFNQVCTQKDLNDIASTYSKVAALMDNQEYSSGMRNSGPVALDIPCTTQTSWLRSYYENIRSHLHCTKDPQLGEQYAKYVNGADRLIVLIDFKEVYQNFAEYFKSDIDKMTVALQACGVAAPNFKAPIRCAQDDQNTIEHSISRKQVIDFMNSDAVNACLSSSELSKKQRKALTQGTKDFKTFFTDLQCVPLAWVNETLQSGPVPPESGCAK